MGERIRIFGGIDCRGRRVENGNGASHFYAQRHKQKYDARLHEVHAYQLSDQVVVGHHKIKSPQEHDDKGDDMMVGVAHRQPFTDSMSASRSPGQRPLLLPATRLDFV